MFDTVADGRHVLTVLALSPDGGQHLTQIGQETLDLAGAHHKAQHPQAAVHLVPVLAASVVRERIVAALRGAAEHDMVVVLAGSDEIGAVVIKTLGVTQPGGGYRAQH